MNENENTNNHYDYSNENYQQNEQLVTLENDESKNKLQINTQIEREMLISVQEFIPDLARSYIESDIQRLNEIHNSSVGELRKNGSLSPELIEKSNKLLAARSMDISCLMPDQAIKLYDFAMEATSAAKYTKGKKLYRLLQQSTSEETYFAINSYNKIARRRSDQNPNYGDYDDADDYDRTSYFNNSKIMNGITERFNEARCIYDGTEYDDYSKSKFSRTSSKDQFSQNIGRIAAGALENIENESSLTDDNIDIGLDKDLMWALDGQERENYNRSIAEEDLDKEDLAYGIFTGDDLGFAETEIELRTDISKSSSNNQHSEKIKEVYTEATVNDIFDHLDVEYIEELISENRLTAKSAVILGVASIERSLSMKDKNILNYAKINLLVNKTEMLCRELLNISSEKNMKNQSDNCKYLTKKCEERMDRVWGTVNKGANNYKKIDLLLQYAQELGIMLDLCSNDDGALIDDGNSI